MEQAGMIAIGVSVVGLILLHILQERRHREQSTRNLDWVEEIRQEQREAIREATLLGARIAKGHLGTEAEEAIPPEPPVEMFGGFQDNTPFIPNIPGFINTDDITPTENT